MSELTAGEFQHSPSFLNEFSFISNPNLNSDGNSEFDQSEIIGGFPIVSNNKYDNSPSIGGNHIEGLCNLKHLYVPPGLVVYSYQSNVQKYNEPTVTETIDDTKFDKLFTSLIHKTNHSRNNKTKKQKTKK
jgi:hypothetical protein